ncbi:MAG: DUF5063 domain-containing protein [Bacteroidales bacterium]|nr:DUF5063 domain-containing protein [Bacteroidales bacterium]
MSTTEVYSKNIIEFVTVAAEYCNFIENVSSSEKKDFFDKSIKLLSVIYLKACFLPKLENIFEEGNEKFVTEEDWLNIQNNVKQKLGKHDEFVDAYAPFMAQEMDAVNISISEIFADIYQDLVDFVTLYRIGHEESMNDAIWECQQNFEQYWGPRLLAALSAMHPILYGNTDWSETKVDEENKDNEPNTVDWIFTQRKKEWGLD